MTPLSSSKISDVVSTTNLPNLSTSFESDRDSGVAIELSSCESSKQFIFIIKFKIFNLTKTKSKINHHRLHGIIRLSLKYCHLQLPHWIHLLIQRCQRHPLLTARLHVTLNWKEKNCTYNSFVLWSWNDFIIIDEIYAYFSQTFSCHAFLWLCQWHSLPFVPSSPISWLLNSLPKSTRTMKYF